MSFPPSSSFPKPFGRDRLDRMGCHDCGDADHAEQGMFIHGKCHPGAGNDVCYRNGRIHVACRECKKPIVAIAVAEVSGA